MTPTRELLTEYWRSIIEDGGSRRRSYEWLLKGFLDLHEMRLPFRAEQLLTAYRRDPAFFFVHVFRIIPWVHLEHPGSDQLGMIEAAKKYERTAVRSGHKVSKSNTLIGIGLWWFSCFPQARVPLTSSSFPQVRMILWYELKQMMRQAATNGMGIGGDLHEDPQIGLSAPDGRQIFGFSTKEPERAAGISGRNIFYMPDEASGIHEPIFEAIEGNRAGGAKLMMTSNPTRVTGYFYEAFHTKAQFWHRVHIPSTYSPNVQAGRIIVPGLATPDWIEEKRQEWGEDSPLYQVRVLGHFPALSEYAIFGLGLIEDAVSREQVLDALEAPPVGDLTIGVDPSGSGADKWVVYPVRGRRALKPRTGVQGVGSLIAEHVLLCVREHRRGRESVLVNVDAIGEGWATIEALTGRFAHACQELGISVNPIVVSETALDEEKYYNKRTEAVFELKRWLEEDGCLPDDGELLGELVSAEYQLRGARYMLIPKDKEKERLKRSPNKRDALALAVYRKATYTVGEHKSAGRRETHSGALKGYMGY